MSRALLVIGAVFFSSYCMGQTNTFPASGNVGIGTLSPSSYFHGGTNRALEVFNPDVGIHSQSHLILSTGSTFAESSAGTVSWVSRNSVGLKGLAYIAGVLKGESSANASGGLVFATSNGISIYQRMIIDKDGNVGIGTLSPSDQLSVNGKIRAKEIKVENANWPDFVFAKSYTLPTLKETETHIKEKGHLPGIPSAAEVKANGVDLGEMNAKLLQKIEELTLHLIRQEGELEKVKKQLKLFKKSINHK